MKALHLFTRSCYASIIFIWLYYSAGCLSAQYAFKLYTKDDGLISNEVCCTYRDSRGFVWIGTREGLQVYNGRYFRSIQHNLLDSNSLSGDWVMAITEDAHGYIWVGTDKGITKVHPGHLKCTRFVPGTNMVSDVNPSYSRVAADDQGRIWAVTSNYILRNDKDSFICTDKIEHHGSIIRTSNHELLITVLDHLFVKNCENGSLKRYDMDGLGQIDLTSSYRDTKGDYWLGTWGDGIIKYDRDWHHVQSFKWEKDPINPSTTNIIANISGDDHFVYVGTSNGLYIYDLDSIVDLSLPYRLIQNSPNERNSISGGMVSNIALDKDHNIWVATSNGLNVSIALNRTFREVTTGTGMITDILWHNNQLIGSSWYGKGLYVWDKNMKIIRTVQYLPEYTNDVDNSQISGIDLDEKDNLWIATFNGLVYYDMQHSKTIAYYTKENDGLSTNRLNDVWVNKVENEVWTANYDHGISKKSLLNGEVTNLNTTTNPEILSNLVWSFYDDHKEKVWVLTDWGICNYNYHEKKWTSWRSVYVNGIEVNIGRCRSLHVDSRGVVWLGTENGLFIYLNSHWYFKGVENGLPERTVNGIAEDRAGNIWISFNHSLLNFNVVTLSSFILSANNDVLLPAIDFIFIEEVNNQLFLVSPNSIYEVDKEAMLATHQASPTVYLEEFLMNGKSYYSISDSFNLEKHAFSYAENNVEISFITPCIGEIGELLYSYRIGSDLSWSAPTDNSRIILPKLPPGNYEIEIRATTDGIHWSKEPLKIVFQIASPFWATWWFIAIVLIIALFITVWWVRFLSTRKMKLKILKLEKEQAVEKERTRLSRDMHDDLGSGLTKISILSEVVKKKMKAEEPVDPYLENISDSSRELVQSLNNIIWSLNPGNDNLQALIAYIREYAAQFLESCQVAFEMDSSVLYVDIDVSEQVKRNIFLVVKETLNNSVKHGRALEVVIKVYMEKNKVLKITIADNGDGMKPNLSSAGNGLKNMDKRMNEIGGLFMIESVVGKGTMTTLTYRF